jgi:hypothetical protein
MGKDQTQASDHPSTNALDTHPLQEGLMEAAFVSFRGTSNGALEDSPELDEERTYIVKAKCVERKHKRNKDHEERIVTVMEIEWMREQGKAPAADPNQGSLLTVVANDAATGDGVEPAEPGEDSSE